MSLQEIVAGNTYQDSQPFRGWFVGDLQTWAAQANPESGTNGFGLRNSQTVEIKWGIHPKGQHRPNGWAGCSSKTSVSVLIEGDFVIQFRSQANPESIQERRINQRGAYVLWREDVEHTWYAQEDSIILTIRWVEANE